MSDKEVLKGFCGKWANKIAWLDARLELDCIHPIFLKRGIKEIPLKKESKVIDIGCGMGWACRQMARVTTEGEVVGIDALENAINKAGQLTLKDKSYDYKNLVYKVANATDIPYPGGYFDYAITFVSFSWWVDPDKALEEIVRVLKLKGKLYVLDVYDKGLGGMLARMSNHFLSFKEKIYSAGQYRTFLEKRFAEVWQKKMNPLGWGLLTVGIKNEC
ncbi:MAG: class I SAM-dependent methyltransferase [Candidatus Thermoplasmatota archaeon]|nr:class I SAM-dependent methyltransferase [Candidatus Thermoplasmatota archaeon]